MTSNKEIKLIKTAMELRDQLIKCQKALILIASNPTGPFNRNLIIALINQNQQLLKEVHGKIGQSISG